MTKILFVAVLLCPVFVLAQEPGIEIGKTYPYTGIVCTTSSAVEKLVETLIDSGGRAFEATYARLAQNKVCEQRAVSVTYTAVGPTYPLRSVVMFTVYQVALSDQARRYILRVWDPLVVECIPRSKGGVCS